MCAPRVTRHTSIRYSRSCHTHASTWVYRYSSLLQWSAALGQRGPVGGSFAYFARNARCTVTTDLLVWYSNTQNDFSPGAAIFSLHTLTSTIKNFCVLHSTVEHNYISSSSTLGLKLHVSVLYVGHLQVVTWLSEELYRMCGVFF